MRVMMVLTEVLEAGDLQKKNKQKNPTGLDDEAFHSACVFSGNFVYSAEISLNLLGV